MKKTHSLLVVVLLVLALFGGVALAEEYFILKGDLHLHSDFSHDSTVPIEQVVAESGLAGYDFIAISDHNTVRHMAKDYSTEEVLVLAGYEHTTQVAHVNIFGLRVVPRKSAIYDLEEMEEYLEPLRAKGAVIQLNHPNDPNYYSRFGLDLKMDLLEVWNGVWREDDKQTLEAWHDLLVSGRYIAASGGTDAHGNHKVRNVFNNVYVTEKSPAAIFEALMAGRNFVTRYVDGAVISMECDGEIMGGTVPYREGQTVTIEIENVAPGLTLKVYTNRGLHLEDRHDKGGSYKLVIDTALVDFFRVELWSSPSAIYAFSNPIFIQH